MAEFVETMRKLREMCKGQKDCRNCTMFIGGLECGASLGSPNLPVKEIERRVEQWEAAKSKIEISELGRGVGKTVPARLRGSVPAEVFRQGLFSGLYLCRA